MFSSNKKTRQRRAMAGINKTDWNSWNYWDLVRITLCSGAIEMREDRLGL